MYRRPSVRSLTEKRTGSHLHFRLGSAPLQQQTGIFQRERITFILNFSTGTFCNIGGLVEMDRFSCDEHTAQHGTRWTLQKGHILTVEKNCHQYPPFSKHLMPHPQLLKLRLKPLTPRCANVASSISLNSLGNCKNTLRRHITGYYRAVRHSPLLMYSWQYCYWFQ